MSLSAVLLACLALAVVDSINPTAIVLASVLMLVRRQWVRAVAALVAGEMVLYFGVGVLVLLGVAQFGERLRSLWYSPAAYAVEAALGVALLVYSFRASPTPAREPSLEGKGVRALFLLGLTIAVVEFSTALPYMGALSLLVREQVPITSALLVLAAYNLVMHAPILVLGLAYSVMPGSVTGRIQGFVDKHRGKGRSAMLWVVGILGGLLVLDALNYFVLSFVITPTSPQGG